MAETKKQRMDSESFIEIFNRYSFEEKGEVLEKLKFAYKKHGEIEKEYLQNSIQSIEVKISSIDKQIQ